MSGLQRYELVTATFQPLRTDDLQNGAEVAIGWRGAWMASWVIERGPYEGQWAMTPEPQWTSPSDFTFDRRWPMAWVPECDLTDIGPPPPEKAT